MLKKEIEPRFSESDLLGHVNNTVIPVWFEHARNPIFEVFNPGLATDNWNLILKKFEIEFNEQIYFGENVEIRTGVERIGNSSMVIRQEVWQSHKMAAKGITVMVHFDFEGKKTLAISDDIRSRLKEFML